MTKVTTLTLIGASGKRYALDTYSKEQAFNDVSAVYVFTRRYPERDGSFTQELLYIGESAQLGTRINNHDKWNCVERNECNSYLGHGHKRRTGPFRR